MDVSETYINMCEKAEEIQKMNVVHPVIPNIFCIYGSYFFCSDIGYQDISRQECNKVTEYRGIWLPSQDQLQEMVGGWPSRGFIDWQEWLGNVYGFNYGDKPNGHLHIFTSGEQLWLAFIMTEKYNKIWKDGKWNENM